MDKINYTSRSVIFYSFTGEKHLIPDQFIHDHLLIHVFTGKMSVIETGRSFNLETGETILLTRDQLMKIIELPLRKAPFKSAGIYFPRLFLKKYYANFESTEHGAVRPNLDHLYKHPLLDSLFNSLLPYSNLNKKLPKQLVEMKLSESVNVLSSLDKSVDKILSDFSEPDQKDIADFMTKNYMFNVPIDRFAYLTGRSAEEFERDFRKAFDMPPQKWLLKKRLERAHELILDKYLNPSEAYIEAGFENFSIFSKYFEKFYGHVPSASR